MKPDCVIQIKLIINLFWPVFLTDVVENLSLRGVRGFSPGSVAEIAKHFKCHPFVGLPSNLKNISLPSKGGYL